MLTEIPDLVQLEVPTEVIAEGFSYTEGPAWDRDQGALFFNDIPADTTYRWTRDGGLAVERHPTGFANGMAIDDRGCRVVCESGANRLVRFDQNGDATVIASTFEGKELNSPNDLALCSNGAVYFTDPAYGRIPVYGQDRPQELGFQGIYRIDAATGELELLERGLVQPNGIALSPDESVLYVADTEQATVFAFDVGSDGRLAERRVFHAPIGPALAFEDARANRLPSGYVDGLKCDHDGNVYVTGPGGIWVLAPTGERIGVIELSEDVANFAWGGVDGRHLFVCCRSFVGVVATTVSGAAAHIGR